MVWPPQEAPWVCRHTLPPSLPVPGKCGHGRGNLGQMIGFVSRGEHLFFCLNPTSTRRLESHLLIFQCFYSEILGKTFFFFFLTLRREMPWEGHLSFSLPHHPRGRLSAGHGLPAASRGSFPQHIVRSCPQSPVRQKQVLCPGKESSAEDLRNVSGESGTGVHVLGEGLPSSAPGILDETSQRGGSHACRKNIKNVLLAKCLPLPVSEFSDTGNSRVPGV